MIHENGLYETGTVNCKNCSNEINWKRDIRQEMSNRRLHLIEMKEDRYTQVPAGAKEVRCPNCNCLNPLSFKTEFYAKYVYGINGRLETDIIFISVNLAKYDEGFEQEASKVIRRKTGILDAKFIGEA